MALDTYSGLKTSLTAYLDRDDLTGQIDDFIDIAEARHAREIRIREMVVRAQATVSERYLSFPDRFLQMQTLRLLATSIYPMRVLQEVSLEGLNRERNLRQRCTGQQEPEGRPEFYALHEEIEFDIAPDEDYTAEMIYWASFMPVSDSNESNGLLTRAPDCYLYAALVAASPFLVDDERIPVWESLYQSARDGLLLADRKSRHGGNLVSRVMGATP